MNDVSFFQLTLPTDSSVNSLPLVLYCRAPTDATACVYIPAVTVCIYKYCLPACAIKQWHLMEEPPFKLTFVAVSGPWENHKTFC